MNALFRPLFNDKPIRYCLFLSLLFLLFQIGITAFIFPKVPPYVPFLNSMPWGESRLVSSYILLTMPLVLFSLFITNVLLSAFLYKKYALIGRMLSFNTFLLFFLGFMAFSQMLFLVF